MAFIDIIGKINYIAKSQFINAPFSDVEIDTGEDYIFAKLPNYKKVFNAARQAEREGNKVNINICTLRSFNGVTVYIINKIN